MGITFMQWLHHRLSASTRYQECYNYANKSVLTTLVRHIYRHACHGTLACYDYFVGKIKSELVRGPQPATVVPSRGPVSFIGTPFAFESCRDAARSRLWMILEFIEVLV